MCNIKFKLSLQSLITNKILIINISSKLSGGIFGKIAYFEQIIFI
jgi:hypothetical protein